MFWHRFNKKSGRLVRQNIYAYRAFRIVRHENFPTWSRTYTLEPLHVGILRYNLHDWTRMGELTPPMWENQYGIWSCKSLTYLQKMVTNPSLYTFGTGAFEESTGKRVPIVHGSIGACVQLGGRTVEHQYGYRSELIRPVFFFGMPHDSQDRKEAAGALGISYIYSTKTVPDTYHGNISEIEYLERIRTDEAWYL